MKYLLLILILLTGCTQNLDKQKLGNILDTVEIGEIEKTIAWTDDNTDEDFIIKVDAPDYITLGGDIEILVSNTLISGKNQYADTFMSPPEGMFVRSVQKFTGNEIVYDIIPKTATTSKQNIPRKVATWEDIEFNENFKIDSSLTRKDTLDRKADRAFNDYFELGKKNIYRLVVRASVEAKDKEWFIETIGDGYGHLDPNLWTYEETFNALTNNSDLQGQGSWTGDTGPQISQAGTPYEGLQHVADNTEARQIVTRVITGIVSGTFYFSIKKMANSDAYPVIKIRNQALGASFYIEWDNFGDINTGGASPVGGSWGFTSGTWDRVGVKFECGAGSWEGLSADTYKLELNESGTWEGPYNFDTVATTLGRFDYWSGTTDSDYPNYFDYISYEYGGAEPPAVVYPNSIQVIINNN